MIKITEVKVCKKRLFCDKCGTEMLWNGIELTTFPPHYPYDCPACGHYILSREQFPKLLYEDVGSEI